MADPREVLAQNYRDRCGCGPTGCDTPAGCHREYGRRADADIAALRDAGFRIAPVEPTQAMLLAGERAYGRKAADLFSPYPTEESNGGALGYAYRAMLAAAGGSDGE